MKLAEIEKVCITVDHWTSYRKGFVGFTVHWYTKDLKKQNACFAIRRIFGWCTYNVLGKLIESVIMEFKLTNKVTHCITDSGSNFVKAFPEFSSFSQTDNDCILIAEDEDCYPISITDCLSDASAEKDFELPPRFKCAVHKLNLVAIKDSGLALHDNVIYKKIYRLLHAKLSAIWKKQTTSVLTSDKIRVKLDKLFIVPNDTCWNSTFDALTEVNDLQNEKNLELASLFIVNENEQKFLKEFLSLMKPLAYAIDILQGNAETCAGYLLPTLINIREERDFLHESGIFFCEELLQCLKNSLISRFEHELKATELQVAAVLHPKFRLH